MVSKYYYFYVLLCADGTFYGGFTDDVEARLATHNAGKGAKYTASGRACQSREKSVYFVECGMHKPH